MADNQMIIPMNELAPTDIGNSHSGGSVRRPVIIALLGSRLLLFLLFQTVIALLVGSWFDSEAYWLSFLLL